MVTEALITWLVDENSETLACGMDDRQMQAGSLGEGRLSLPGSSGPSLQWQRPAWLLAALSSSHHAAGGHEGQPDPQQ